ncbi:pectin acetylesterase-family hydrolase [Pyxidicoccus trucidator]|uniref:pectin acetylesterase-family hydrolase n=1 Tax=Pyxidicoccus trucidator TaxID=2709662 RepID=UPI0013D9A6D5|nr:pectin acetylesterase-family hydrolase [Pyxidicoccus trucidator]
MRKLLLTLFFASVPLWFAACGDDDDDTCDRELNPECIDAGTPGGNADAGFDAGTADPDGGLAIVADPEVWTWVDVAGTACGNGAQTGIGINPTNASTDLYIFMQGGGACWDELTCFTRPSASYLSTGYQAAQFQTEGSRNLYMFNRVQEANPFQDMSFIFVPYCTGDVHGGNAVQTYGANQVHHKGAANVQAWLPRLAATFPTTQRVFLAGSSAGAFGAQLNYERVIAAFPSAEVHVLADSGQMITPAGPLLNTWLTNWGVSIPAACTDCTTDFTKFPAYLADTYPDTRFGLLAWDQDNVLRAFFGYPAATYRTLTLQLLTSSYDGRANAKYFLKVGTQHTFLSGLNTITSTTGVTLNTWVTQWVTGDAAWSNVQEQ